MDLMRTQKKVHIPGSGFTLSYGNNDAGARRIMQSTDDGKQKEWKPTQEEILSGNWEVAGA